MKQTAQNLTYKTQNNNTKNRRFFGVFGVVVFMLFCFLTNRFFVIPVHAAINNEINFQGKLTNADGTNVADSAYTVIFSLYNVSSSGTALWTETDSVTTTNGIFQVPLGAVTSLPGNVDFNNNSIYLGIKVGSDAEMTPRIRFSAVPYAFNAAALDDVVATESATGFSMQGGTSSVSSLAFTTIGGALTFQPGIAEGLTVQSNGANGLTLDTGGGAAVSIGTGNATSVAFGKTANNTSFTFNNGSGGFTVNGTGSITFSALNTADGLIYTSGTNGVLSQTAPLGGSQCLQSNSGNTGLTWISCSSAGTNYWNQTNGVLTPLSETQDLLLGSTATTSADFAFTGVDSSTPIASISAFSNGGNKDGISLNASTSTIQAFNMNSLTLGGTTTGNVQFFGAGNSINSGGNLTLAGTTGINLTGNSADINFSGTGADTITTASGQAFALMPGGSAGIGINTTVPLAALDVRGNLGTTPTASISGTTSFAAMVVNNSGSGDLFTASKSGATKFTILNNGAIQLNNYTANGGLLFTSGTGVVAQTAVGTSAQCLLGGATPIFGTCALGTNEWQQISGAISPSTITDDVLLGGTATASARFAFTNDVGAGTPTASISANVGNNATYLTGTGTLATTNDQTLTLGSASTGNISLNSGAAAELTVFGSDAVGVGNVGASALATLDVRGTSGTNSVASVSGATTFAGLVVNNSGTGDLLTASSSGKTKFDVTNSGNVFFGGDTISASSSGSTNNGSPDEINALGDEGSLVPNAGFEADLSHSVLGDGWVPNATNAATLVLDTTQADAAQGTNSLKYTSTAATAQQATFYSACIPLTGIVADTYDLAWAQKGSAASVTTVRGYIDQYTTKANCLSNTSVTYSATAATPLAGTTWADVSVPTVAPAAGTTWARVHIAIASQANAVTTNIDSVRLIESSLLNGLDYAEDYPADPNNTPVAGQVASLEASGDATMVAPSDIYMDDSVIGVVSTNPGQVLDDGSMTNPVPIALAGRVPVNVSTANGSIQVGDYLTSSTTPGVAVKATGAGSVIGTAMEDDTDTNTTDVTQVTMFIKNTYYNGGTQSSTSGLDLLSNEQDASVILQLLQGTENTSSSVSLSDIANGDSIDGLSLLLSAVSEHIASGSASQIATSSANFQNNQLTINGLSVSGSATVSADLHVKGNGLVEGILHIADTLFANNLIANGISDFFGNVIFHSGVTFTNAPVFDKDTAGFAVISKGADHVDVTFSAPYDQTPIINASITLNPITPTPNETLDQQQTRESQLESAALGNIHYIIINRTTKGFTILLDQPAAEDISFSWVALAVNSPVIFQSNGQNLQLPTPTEDVTPSPMDTIIPSGIPVSPILTPTGDDTPTPDAGG